MSDELGFIVALVFTEVIPAAVFLYAAYWAFAMRRALVSRMYRRQAMWLGVVAIVLAVLSFVTYSNDAVVNELISVFYALLFIVVFAYTDSMIPVVRRSDPLLRDILHWGNLRYFLWFDAALLAAFTVTPGLSFPLSVGKVGFILQGLGWFVVAVILYGVSGVAILVGGRRSGDMVLRSSLKWIGVTLLLAIVVILFAAAETAIFPNMTSFQFYYSYAALPIFAPFIAIGYCFYRSARALAPVGKIQDQS